MHTVYAMGVVHNLMLCMYVLARTCMQYKVRHIYTGTYMLLVGVFYPYPNKRCFSLCLQVWTNSDLEFKVFFLSAVMIKYFSHRQRLHFFDPGEYVNIC